MAFRRDAIPTPKTTPKQAKQQKQFGELNTKAQAAAAAYFLNLIFSRHITSRNRRKYLLYSNDMVERGVELTVVG